MVAEAMFRPVSGHYMDLLNPVATDIHIRDIAHGLSNLCRFNGHTPEFYSVAQHSVLCYHTAKVRGYTPEEQFACLLHDAAEAYVGDLVRPLKQHLSAFRLVEQGVDLAIAEYVGFDHRDHSGAVKIADMTALATEKRYLFPEDNTSWDGLVDVTPVDLPGWYCWTPARAEASFLWTYTVLRRQWQATSSSTATSKEVV